MRVPEPRPHAHAELPLRKREAAAPATIQSRVASPGGKLRFPAQQDAGHRVLQSGSELDAMKRGNGYGVGLGGSSGAQRLNRPRRRKLQHHQHAGGRRRRSDFVKNDGTRFSCFSGRTCHRGQLATAELSDRGQLVIEGWPDDVPRRKPGSGVSSIGQCPGRQHGPGGAPAAALCPSTVLLAGRRPRSPSST